MGEFNLRVSEAALDALRGGEGDSSRVVEIFRQRAPGPVHLPSHLTAGDIRELHRLLEFSVAHATVFNGTRTFAFPNVLALGRTLNPNIIGATGFLISPDVVVTAAHALDNEHGRGIWRDDLNGTRIPVQVLQNIADLRSVPSPTHDIGLIKLSQSLANVEIYKLASSQTIDEAESLRIVGYGRDATGAFGVKRTALVNRRPEPIPNVIVPPDSFVIGDPSTDEDGDACFRDSGGPVLVDVGGTFRLAGLISEPVVQGVCGDGTFCLRLDRVTTWIDENIQALGGQPRPV